MLQAMEIEQYFHADEIIEKISISGGCEEQEKGLINGYHINIFLKNEFIESCKSVFSMLIVFCRFDSA
jgi:hypothetical protein